MFKKVVLVGRRTVELPQGPGYDKMVRASVLYTAAAVLSFGAVLWTWRLCAGRSIHLSIHPP